MTELEKVPSVKDQGQTDCVLNNILSNPNTWPLIMTFNQRQSTVGQAFSTVPNKLNHADALAIRTHF